MLPGGGVPASGEDGLGGRGLFLPGLLFVPFFTVTSDFCSSLLSPCVPVTKVTVNYYEEDGSAPIDQAGLFLTAIGELVLGSWCLNFGGAGKVLRAISV